jgi:hypothetical protein
MVKKDNTYQDSIEIGQKNQRILPDLKRWCRHIEVEQTSAGLLAQMTGLPIGFLRVTCPHGAPVGESMHLDWEAKRFILHNCLTCPHHAEVSPDNYGRRMLAEKEKADADALMAESHRQRLKDEAFTGAQAALKTPEITQGSVNRLILELQSPVQGAQDLSAQLLEASRLGPEFFSDTALRVLADGFLEEQGDVRIEVVRQVCQHRRSIPDFIFESASRAISEKASDPACGIIADFITFGGDISKVLTLLPSIIALPDYHRFGRHGVRSHFDRAKYPGAIGLLNVLMNADPKPVQQEFTAALRAEKKYTRVNAIETLSDLLPNNATTIVPLTAVLLRSLELADDFHMESADAAACHLLALLYAHSPSTIDEQLERYYPHTSDEVKLLILEVYYNLTRLATVSEDAEFTEVSDSPPHRPNDYVVHVPQAVEKLYLACSDLRLPIKSRRHVYELLRRALDKHPQEALTRLNKMLARLEMTIREAESSNQDASQSTLDKLNINSNFDSVIREIVDCILIAIRLNPPDAFPHIQAFLNSLSSKTSARAKTELVSTLSIFARTYELTPQVIPQLYKHFVDFESNLVRARAIQAAGHILDENPDIVPDNI